MPFSYRAETRDLNEVARQEASGSFIQLSDGFTHYELGNPAPPRSGEAQGSRAVVLVHGFSVPYFIYDPTFTFLTGSGFRVLRYDLYGRGFSDRPDTAYNIDLFVRQLAELLDGLHLADDPRGGQPVSLVGLSTGGPITASFTARFPERVSKLVLIDPVGAKALAFAPLLKAASMPRVGEAIASLIRSEGPGWRIVSYFFDRESVQHFRPRYAEQMKYRGFRRALLSTIRNHMLDSFLDEYEQVGKMEKPVLLLWGRHDTTVPLSHSSILRHAMPSAQFHICEECGHIPHYEKPEEVNPILLEFLRRQP